MSRSDKRERNPMGLTKMFDRLITPHLWLSGLRTF